MLYLAFFDADADGLHYYGFNRYHITQDGSAYAVKVEVPEDGDPSGDSYTPGETYAASTISIAIDIVDNLEAG